MNKLGPCNKKYVEDAAQIWCHDAVSHIEMIPELCMLIALKLKYWHERGYAEGKSFAPDAITGEEIVEAVGIYDDHGKVSVYVPASLIGKRVRYIIIAEK